MIVFILSLFSSGHKLRISSLTNSLWKTNDFSTYLWIYPRTLFIHNSFPELKQDKFYQILQKLRSKVGSK